MKYFNPDKIESIPYTKGFYRGNKYDRWPDAPLKYKRPSKEHDDYMLGFEDGRKQFIYTHKGVSL